MNRYLTLLCSILLIKALCIVLVILYAGIGLGPDEAQYWTWSQALDWGYYSKPPGIAWQIWMGTHLFGNNELGVRFMSVVIGTLIPLSIYLMGIKAGLKQQVAFWAALLLALSPLGLLATFLAITDGGMFLFWTLACVIIVDALHREVTPNYLLFGFMVLLGALFKWPIYLLWVMVLISMLFWPVLRSHTIVFGGLVSLLGLFPSVIWNSQHEWSTFRHVFSTVKGGEKKALFSGNFFEFFGLQMGLLSPLLFILLLISFYYLINHRKTTTKALKFCGYTSLGLLLSAW
jgi:4-amino-4-deoxy-L-arabinose transferase-like glycosyltransferase